MIDVNESDIVIARRTSRGRTVLFTSTDVLPDWPIRWWGVIADTGGDGFGLLVRLHTSAAPEGWTARQLLAVAQARMAAENQRRPSAASVAAIAHLDLASTRCRHSARRLARDDPVAFELGGEPSPYPWTVARCGEFHLPLCPDAAGLEEGITPEQLLIILDQLLHDATRAFPQARDVWACRRHIATALAAEVRRASSKD
jgi:hypothetical protein